MGKKMDFIQDWVFPIITISMFLLLGYAMLISDNKLTPNQEYIDEVVEYVGYEPCCDETWFEMCEEYKEVKNISFECFT